MQHIHEESLAHTELASTGPHTVKSVGLKSDTNDTASDGMGKSEKKKVSKKISKRANAQDLRHGITFAASRVTKKRVSKPKSRKIAQPCTSSDNDDLHRILYPDDPAYANEAAAGVIMEPFTDPFFAPFAELDTALYNNPHNSNLFPELHAPVSRQEQEYQSADADSCKVQSESESTDAGAGVLDTHSAELELEVNGFMSLFDLPAGQNADMHMRLDF